MFRLDMSESTARFTFVAACGLSMFAASASIFLGIDGSGAPAALFLAFALVGCMVTIASYNRYARLRNARWRSELKGTEEELTQVLNHARMGIIIDHVTGPLKSELSTDTPEESTVVKP